MPSEYCPNRMAQGRRKWPAVSGEKLPSTVTTGSQRNSASRSAPLGRSAATRSEVRTATCRDVNEMPSVSI
jgi:hypothetical protein